MKFIYRSLHLVIQLFIIIIIALLTSCEEKIVEPYDSFVLPAGRHSGFNGVQSLQSRSLSFTAIFDETAKYQTVIPENQYDINKLLGFSDCNSVHHHNSARFGWRWVDNQLEIHAYAYVDGDRKNEFVGIATLNRPYDYRLSFTDDAYHFYMEGVDPVTILREPVCNRGFYYMLYPYFGGDEPAPHDILIKIRFDY